MNEFVILYDNADLIVVSKLTPLPVLSDTTGDPCLADLVASRVAETEGGKSERCEAAHRIDRPVSGIVVFAKREASLKALSRAFRDRRVEKRYLAAVSPAPVPPAGRVVQLIGWNKARSKAFLGPVDPAVRGGKIRRDMKEAILEYETLAMGEYYALVEVKMETGRHHQIRAQLAALGSPVKGDVKYGARRPNRSGLIGLHAWKLTLPAEFGVPPLEAPPPSDDGVWDILSAAPVAPPTT